MNVKFVANEKGVGGAFWYLEIGLQRGIYLLTKFEPRTESNIQCQMYPSELTSETVIIITNATNCQQEKFP